jgi:hypothetical protein
MARTAKTETYLVNKKYLGDEPVDTGSVLSIGQYGQALNWYNYMCTVEDAREYLVEYLNSKDRLTDIKMLNRVDDNWIITSTAWIARMHMRGIKLPEHDVDAKIDEKLSKILEKATPEVVKAQTNVVKLSVHHHVKEKASDIIAEIERLIDSGQTFSMYNWLQSNNVLAIYVPTIVQKYQPWLDEMKEAYAGNDPDLKEAYAHLTRRELKKRVEWFETLIDDALRHGGNVKKVRKPRKKKSVPASKKLKTFKYQKSDTSHKIASINPEKVLGSQELWTFNTKYKTLTVFRALDRGGLQVKGTSIIGYDENTSVTKRIGRKTDEYLDKVLNGGKIVLRKLMDDINTTAPLAHRTSENTILLRVS